MKRPTRQQIEQAQREAAPLPWTYWAVCAVVALATIAASALLPSGLQVMP